MSEFIVFIPVTHQGRMDLMNVDLVFQGDGSPLAVLEWADFPDGTCIPSVAVQLEPQWLTRTPGMGPATHSYERPICPPAPLHPSTGRT